MYIEVHSAVQLALLTSLHGHVCMRSSERALPGEKSNAEASLSGLDQPSLADDENRACSRALRWSNETPLLALSIQTSSVSPPPISPCLTEAKRTGNGLTDRRISDWRDGRMNGWIDPGEHDIAAGLL